MRHDVFAQLLARYSDFKKRTSAGIDTATVNAQLSRDFEKKWTKPDGRVSMVPGKEVLAQINHHLQETCGVTLTDASIAVQFKRNTLPDDLLALLDMLKLFSESEAPE